MSLMRFQHKMGLIGANGWKDFVTWYLEFCAEQIEQQHYV